MGTDKYELINDLLDESSLVLNYVLTDLLQLEANPHIEHINRLSRAFQSIKDISLMAGFEHLSALAKYAEEVLFFMRCGKYQSDNITIDFLLGSVEKMHLILDDIREGKQEPRNIDDLLDLLKKIQADSDSQDTSSTCKQPDQSSKNSLQQEQLKILIVEDDATSRSVLVQFLSEFGICDEAKDGIDAIEAVVAGYEQDPPKLYDLICMDILMPVMDGTLATKKIREIERNKGIEGTDKEAAIIIASSVSDPATIIKACYECGANYYFIKPLVFKQMRHQLQKLGLIS